MATTKFDANTTALEVVENLNVNLENKVVFITGGTSGIGVETARALATTKAHVFITARDITKGKEVVEELKKTTGNAQIDVLELDLTSLKSVEQCVQQFRTFQLPIHILICNAGIMAVPYSKTVDGFESQFGVNHLSHFYLVKSFLPELELGAPSRVVMVSSVLNKFQGINWEDIQWEQNYDKWLAYGQSKTANILFALQMNELYKSKGISSFALNPGAIMTNLQNVLSKEEQQSMGYFKDDGSLADFFKSVQQGAATSVYAALDPQLVHSKEIYLENCQVSNVVNDNKTEFVGRATHAADLNEAKKLWILSENLLENCRKS
ncbi:unnamed protein product [Adineta ricciae]|uniref:Uncharacterized protein n=1 Tax=Adineta ricciae TaxID=249248 RepID=A0A815UTF0_ADIRI|nr:unnamed protein product [Adineta ricciae]CAF1520402.1 unnamed protein product [Adineta ricciae]